MAERPSRRHGRCHDRGGLQLTNSDRFTLPITGGTGAYLGASGQVMVHTLKGKGNPTDVTVELE